MIRVLVADDQALVRGGFRVLVDSEPDMTVVGEAGDGGTAAALARELRPDVVLMDVQMPGVDGLEAIRRIAADPELGGVRILILTTFDEDDYVIEGLAAGASGFLLKNTDPGQLLHGIRVVAGGEELLSPGLTRRLIARTTTRAAVDHDVFAQLTAREREVVALVAQGLGNDEITRELVISPATTKTHVSRALAKLGARDRAQLVALAYRHGLVRPG
ncbi:response regulator transcription factor [Actinosynnema sp. NPDC047251]|uniref:Two-component system, response regulator of the LuxR family n=1 Tax=Saccharothrix espanaensis (strain ATCC 51144 / DSM 44229 / JCM 9112 / NBRC 15066 / NRRL 15764) TaxID=1179773 RepID=K0K5V8_SACES|nr:response regulator transcription factor [Saccharothrix espanaensis]CCH35640.1 Two-component system, response regulator of the LuxR family [Saccharothrix espanaensis DSM 44229]